MENVGVFNDHLMHFTAIWYFYGDLVYFVVIWYFLPFRFVVSRKIWQPWHEKCLKRACLQRAIKRRCRGS
jgi:hypothetical protein